MMKPLQIGLFLLLSALFTGCATSGRYVLLREYNPTIEKKMNSPLKGVTVAVKPFVEDFKVDAKLETIPNFKNLDEPPNFAVLKMAEADVKRWGQEAHNLHAANDKGNWKEIGYVRNGFGAVLSKVHALSPPGQWLTDTLKTDLPQAGAQVTDSGDADVEVRGTIRFFKVDIYMKYWADLIVDVEIQPKGKPPVTRRIHTSGGQAAWSSSSWEYYQPIRQCQQKLTQTLIAEIETNVRK